MNTALLTFLLVGFGIVIILFFIKKWLGEMSERNKPSDELVQWLKSVTQSLESSNQNVDRKLTENMKNFNDRLDKAAYVIAEVQKNIGEFSEIGRGMKDLQQFLRSPKLRGNIGEQVLNDLLKQFLPKQSYKIQHQFKNGEKVDVVIITSQGLVPVDSKFPMEQLNNKKEFLKIVKKHISDIAKKYIRPSEGTVDYALMYIPSESIYYEIISSEEIYNFSTSLRIVLVSPMSFYAYLKAILMSFEGQKIEQKAKEIVMMLAALRKDYQKTDEAISVLNKHITNAYNQVSTVGKLFLSFGQKLDSTRLLEGSDTEIPQRNIL